MDLAVNRWWLAPSERRGRAAGRAPRASCGRPSRRRRRAADRVIGRRSVDPSRTGSPDLRQPTTNACVRPVPRASPLWSPKPSSTSMRDPTRPAPAGRP